MQQFLNMMMPTLARYMTPKPLTISPRAPLAEAHRLMRDHEIRHLPVVVDERVIGLVSMHDLHLLETFPGVDLLETTVEDAMSTEVYTASTQEDIANVVEHMADHKLGCVVITNAEGAPQGIFTSVDAMYVLSGVLRRQTA